MTPRSQEVLFSIVRAYIDSGEPQGSRTISRALDSRSPWQAASPATIRNLMADLTDEGFLAQPHTSAGRIPTEKAFRAYVGSLSARPMPPADAQRLVSELGEIGSLQGRVEHSCRLLTEISHAVGIAAVQPGGQQLEHIELVALSDRRLLIVVVTRDGNASNRVVTLEEAISSDELGSLRNYINWNFTGWNLEDARRELQRRIEDDRAECQAILRRLTTLCDKGFLAADTLPHAHMEGASNLMGLDLHLTRERMRDLFRTLEEKKRVAELLDRFLEESSGVGVQIGLAEAHPFMKELALVGVTIHLPGGMVTRVAVLGPMRMNYGRIMSAVLEIGRAFEKVQAV